MGVIRLLWRSFSSNTPAAIVKSQKDRGFWGLFTKKEEKYCLLREELQFKFVGLLV